MEQPGGVELPAEPLDLGFAGIAAIWGAAFVRGGPEYSVQNDDVLIGDRRMSDRKVSPQLECGLRFGGGGEHRQLIRQRSEKRAVGRDLVVSTTRVVISDCCQNWNLESVLQLLNHERLCVGGKLRVLV